MSFIDIHAKQNKQRLDSSPMVNEHGAEKVMMAKSCSGDGVLKQAFGQTWGKGLLISQNKAASLSQHVAPCHSWRRSTL